ncbi:MAG TPA: hypothetical protein VFO49_02855 [Nocardioides sp.]|nr:hypothetical protein [Nocardioides sp.]
MRDLHEQLRNLVSQHGTGIVDTAEQFRGALDDYLTEQDATQGELNLLVDAVRLGGVERLLAMLDNGADPDAAVREAGGELARDRSSDEQRARWAVAAMGYALGRLDAVIVRAQLEGDVTRLPYGATSPAAQRPPVQSPPYQPPVQSPPYQAPPVQSPAWPTPHYASAPTPPKKSRTGLIVGLVAAGVVVVALAVVLALVTSGDDPEEKSDDNGDTTQTCDPCLEGEGYQYELPEGWNDITDQVLEDNPGQPTLDTASAWGDSVEAGRANVIIEVSSWTYNDLEDAVGILSDNLSNLGGEIEDLDDRTIDGEQAKGVLLTRTNDSGVEVEQTAYIVKNGDDAVVITASNKSDDDGPADAYEKIYDSWSWE